MELALITRRTIVVEGTLAFRVRRDQAAKSGEVGVQIVSIPMLAARLAGGFLRAAESHEIDSAIRMALDAGSLGELQHLRDLPGMTRAVATALRRLWDADISAEEHRHRSSRWASLAIIESRVRSSQRGGALLPRDLRTAAMDGLPRARALLGPVELLRVPDISPIWRPLISELGRWVECRWIEPGAKVSSWYNFDVVPPNSSSDVPPIIESCSNPRSEAVEALRWARQLVSSAAAKPEEIAICATSTMEWDAHFIALAAKSGIPLHFSHGLPALATWEGQACAALADLLLHGLDQPRLRRLIGYSLGRCEALRELPKDWWLGLEAGAALGSVAHWHRALERARKQRTDDSDVAAILLPALDIIKEGMESASKAESLLPRGARTLWRLALQHAPAAALEYSLQALRVPDSTDPGSSVVWGPARHLEAAPRRELRLLGLTSRTWPRSSLDDPLLPDAELEGLGNLVSVRELDERAFHSLRRITAKHILSRSRRSSQGTVHAESPLLGTEWKTTYFRRDRVPAHACNETDRLIARPVDFAQHPLAKSAIDCWANWHAPDVTVHDGMVAEGHAIVKSAIAAVQSATSLHRMLRDPIGFMWRYGMGWRAPQEEGQPLSLDPASFGELVHALLKEAISVLEPTPGLIFANRTEIQDALKHARSMADESWPLLRAVPPTLLWGHTLDQAVALALRALTVDESFMAGTRTWSEVDFGYHEGQRGNAQRPWDTSQPVGVPGTNLRIKGTIDRIDLRKEGDAVRVTDYKTGVLPPNTGQVRFGFGGDLQRVIYAIAAQALLPGPPKVVTRLVYLASDPPQSQKLMPQEVDEAIAECARLLMQASDILGRGMTLPGPDSESRWNSLRIALPAAVGTYWRRKRPAVKRALGGFTRVWEAE